MRLFPSALILLLAWGALAFGGSLTWAAASIAVLALTTGVLGFLERSHTPSVQSFRYRAVTAAIALVLVTVVFQLVPFGKDLVDRLSPSRSNADYEQLLARADRRDPALVQRAPEAPAPLSIAPSRTALGLAGLAALAILLVGTSHGLSTTGTLGIVRAVAALGVTVTMVGLYQLTTATRLVYGWYVPLFTDARSAPFLNPNHQAGWLVMALSLTLGAFAGDVARGMRGVAPNWRARILWLSTKDANVAVLMLFSSAVIAAGILAAGSRGGALAMMLTFLLVAGWNSRRQLTRVRRVATAAGLTALGLALLAFNGQAVLLEISQTKGPGIRLQVWQDTWRIANDFWLAGSGFNTYGAAMLHYQTVKDGFRYAEAHNDYLQLAAEGGLLVGLPILVLAGVLIAKVWRRFAAGADDARTYWVRIGAVTGILAIALQSVVDFTLQMPGAAVMFTTLVAIAIHHPPARVVLLPLLLLGVAANAHAQPGFAAAAGSITAVSDAPEAASRMLGEIEFADALFTRLVGAERSRPLRGFAVRNSDALRELAPQFWERRGIRPRAVAHAGPHTAFLAVREDLPEAAWRQAVLHEYVHLLTAERLPGAPAWLDEGLAEFWSAVFVDGNRVIVGRPTSQHVAALRHWRPLQRTLRQPRGELIADSEPATVFYAQSWAMVHYLLVGQDVNRPLAFVPASTELPPDFEAAFRRYVSNGHFPEVTIPFTPPVATVTNATAIPAAQSLAERAHMLVFGARPDTALPLARRALALEPGQPLALEVIGTYYFLHNRPDDAREWLTRAFATHAASPGAVVYLALLAQTKADRERYLTAAVAARPDFEVAWQHLAGVYRDDGRLERLREWCRRLEQGAPWLWPGLWLRCG